MSGANDDALEHLGQVTATAMGEVLEVVAPGSAQMGTPRVLGADESPLADVDSPVIAASVDFVDGITGGNVVLLSRAAAQRLAAAMMGADPAEADVEGELDELATSAVSEATNQIMAGAAAAVSSVLGQELEISPPRSAVCATTDDLMEFFMGCASAPHTVRTSARVCGEPAWIVQQVPTALAVRVATAREQQASEHVEPVRATDGTAVAPELSDVAVRVWAELGRTTMPAMAAAALPSGAVVEFDRRPDDPVELYVNGRCLAHGRLVVVDGTDWAFQIDAVVDAVTPDPIPNQGPL